MSDQAQNAGAIVILGADGYLGWPLAVRLARHHPSRRIVLVDNFLRRRLVSEVGGHSLLPVLEPAPRVEAFREIYGLGNMQFIQMDVSSEALDALIKEIRPLAVYHLAQQCSAPYSMRGSREAVLTLRNNEEGNMRLLWAVRQHVPDCHVIKLGSFGEYAKSGLEVAEGYFTPVWSGKHSGRPVPYPREADDFYHASKINDTNYISVACRKWGLRATDVMQSTIFGTWTPDIGDHQALCTRLDYDECFGTVVNRFLAQSLCGRPLTVYGTGHQRTGLMALNDSVDSLARLWPHPPPAGTHRVINHLTEDSFSINELAETVRELVAQEGFTVDIQRGVHNPRMENEPDKQEYEITRRYVRENLIPTPLGKVVSTTLKMLLPYRDRINLHGFAPTTLWNPSGHAGSGVVVPLTASRLTEKPPRRPDDEFAWEGFRLNHFPYWPVNLNPGTLGTPSRDVREAMQGFDRAEELAYPLEQYRRARQAMADVVETARLIWKSPGHMPNVVGGASHCSNLLALALTRIAARRHRPLRVLTTPHEHVGGIGAFERMHEFEVEYLTEPELRDLNAFEQHAERFDPDVAFFSHLTYDDNRILPVSQWGELLTRRRPESLILVDVSQSLGRMAPPFAHADALFGSGHKWLFGPRGSGLLWTNERFRRAVAGLYWSGEPLSMDPETAGFSPAGAVDFSVFAGLDAALHLHLRVGDELACQRGAQLAARVAKRAGALFDSFGVEHTILESSAGGEARTGTLTVSFPRFDPYPLYTAMNQRMLHCKCIKHRTRSGAPKQLLRFGIPYYETLTRLRDALAVLESCLWEVCAAGKQTYVK
jgi:UDP-sulfoquinovose synthase